MSGETMTLARFVSALDYKELPSEVVERTRLLVMDHVGIALRARHAADLNPSVSGALTALGFVGGQSSVVGDLAGYAPPAAAFTMGTSRTLLILMIRMRGARFIRARPLYRPH